MIEFRQGNIFESGAQVLVNPVNCVGVMGAGLALEFKKRFPGNFEAYKDCCDRGQLFPGQVFAYLLDGKTSELIINVPTKDHWKSPSTLDYVNRGLRALVKKIEILECEGIDVDSIALPALGCGKGGLQWEDVRPLMVSRLDRLSDFHIQVLVYEPA